MATMLFIIYVMARVYTLLVTDMQGNCVLSTCNLFQIISAKIINWIRLIQILGEQDHLIILLQGMLVTKTPNESILVAEN